MNKATLTAAWDGVFIREKSHRGVSQDLNIWPHRLCPVRCQEDCDLHHRSLPGGTIWHVLPRWQCKRRPLGLGSAQAAQQYTEALLEGNWFSVDETGRGRLLFFS